MFLFSTLSFGFRIDELEFGKEIKQKEKAEKVFTLTNNGFDAKLYRFSIEDDKNIKITPNLLNLLPQQSREFKVEVTGNKPKGDYSYFLVIKEVKKEKSKKDVDINKTIRIKQKYKVK